MKKTIAVPPRTSGFKTGPAGPAFEPPAAAGIRPLQGPGPWTLVEVADAAGVSYDAVYRDVRRGILTALRVRRGEGRGHYLVSIVNLRHSARPCYRHVPRMAVSLWRAGARAASWTDGARDAQPGDGRGAGLFAPVAAPPVRRLKGVLGVAMQLMAEDAGVNLRE